MNFIAIDVETANPDMGSICQIGWVRYENDCINDEFTSYIDPEDYFDPWNVAIHGITAEMVKQSPRFPQIHGDLSRILKDTVVICHTAFDRIALQQACGKYDLPPMECNWLDTARVARRTWEDFAWKGYGLANVCAHIGYEFKHHNALDDAKAAARVLLAASAKTGLDMAGWLKRVEQPISPNCQQSVRRDQQSIRRDGNPEGDFYGEVIVFTGALEIPRRTAADMAAQIGCQVGSGVTQETTLLVVGNQDARRLAGNEKSSKHRKAEVLISKGFPIRILTESDFQELVKLSH
ncbi:MAG TPA: exonuclease domain-containing protein [Armatimonadota bacterium]|nr:exonuclease domain-containing protein [Armatimonadota bacterium]HOM71498.1 exonuclease domain-containing protein [Armatimonadota bacterium]